MVARTIPFVGLPTQRDTSGTEDQRFVNVLFEVNPNPAPGEVPITVIKRPGLANHTQPPGGSAEARGIYAWDATGKIYSAFGHTLYADTTPIGSASFSASAGRVYFMETHVSTGTRQLVVSDGSDNFNITTSDAATIIDATDDSDYPADNIACIVPLDGYIFQAQSNGKIWNTDLNSATAWTATSFLTADTHGGDLVAIHKQKDQIIAWTKNRTEFFFNNGNPTGSPLLRIDQNTIFLGMAHRHTLAWSGETCCYVAQNASDGDGGRTVMMITSLGKVKEISNQTINRFLAAEGTSISSASAWMERVAGQIVYVLNLSSANRTFVYGVDTGLWCEWESAAGTKFPGYAATSLNGVVYVQDATNGRVYSMSSGTYQDSGTTFSVTKQTRRDRRGSRNRKFEHSIDLDADTTTGTLSVSWSDNDFSTFVGSQVIDMTIPKKRITRLGAFYERSYKFVYSQNAPYRARSYTPEWEEGES